VGQEIEERLTTLNQEIWLEKFVVATAPPPAPEMVAIRELLRAGYLPIRGGSWTRRELRCPVK
jgi:hypothetical protein